MIDNKRIIGFGILSSLIFLVSVLILFFHLHDVNMCGFVNLLILVPAVFYISFLFSFFAIVLFNINKKRGKITEFSMGGFLMTLMFFIGILVFMISNSYVPGLNVREAFMKSDMNNLKIAMEEYHYKNGYYPEDIQELNHKIGSNPRLVKIEMKSTGKLDAWYIEANLYDVEKRFPCKDITRVVKTYYCNQDGCEFQ